MASLTSAQMNDLKMTIHQSIRELETEKSLSDYERIIETIIKKARRDPHDFENIFHLNEEPPQNVGKTDAPGIERLYKRLCEEFPEIYLTPLPTIPSYGFEPGRHEQYWWSTLAAHPYLPQAVFDAALAVGFTLARIEQKHEEPLLAREKYPEPRLYDGDKGIGEIMDPRAIARWKTLDQLDTPGLEYFKDPAEVEFIREDFRLKEISCINMVKAYQAHFKKEDEGEGIEKPWPEEKEDRKTLFKEIGNVIATLYYSMNNNESGTPLQ